MHALSGELSVVGWHGWYDECGIGSLPGEPPERLDGKRLRGLWQVPHELDESVRHSPATVLGEFGSLEVAVE